MTTLTPFLRNVVLADAATGVGAGLVLIGGADMLAPVLGLPSALLFWAGLALIPFVAALVMILRSNRTTGLGWIVGINFAWVAASLYVAFGPSFAPSLFGQIFVCAQAATVFLLAELQVIGLRRSRATA